MASLNNTELSKYRNGEYRWLKFQRKMNAGEPFTLSPQGKKIFGRDSIRIKPVEPYMFVRRICEGVRTGSFKSLNGVKFRDLETDVTLGLTALEKTEEFGSSKGLGGGTQQTAYVESRTARECAKLSGGQINGLTQSELLADHTIEDAYWKTILDKSWLDSFTETPQAIVSSSLTLPDYHFQDQTVKWIEDSYKKCRVGTSFATRNINKWNPADIWCSSGSLGNISSSLASCSTLEELNEVCYSSTLKGISLKKNGTSVKEVDSSIQPWNVEKWEIKNYDDWYTGESSCLVIRFNLEGGKDKLLIIRPDRNIFKAEVKTVGADHRNGSCGLTELNGCLDENELGFRFQSLKDIPDKHKKEEAQIQIRRFADALLTCPKSRKLIADIVRRCVCQSRGHCTYLKVS